MRCPNCGGTAIVLDVESVLPVQDATSRLELAELIRPLLLFLGLLGQLTGTPTARVTTRVVQCTAPPPYGCSTLRQQRETRIVEDLGETSKRYVRAG